MCHSIALYLLLFTIKTKCLGAYVEITLCFPRLHFTLLCIYWLTQPSASPQVIQYGWMASSAFQPTTAASYFLPDGMTVLSSMLNRGMCVITRFLKNEKERKKRGKMQQCLKTVLYFLGFYCQHKNLEPDSTHRFRSRF